MEEVLNEFSNTAEAKLPLTAAKPANEEQFQHADKLYLPA
jgi:hypothetical protein